MRVVLNAFATSLLLAASLAGAGVLMAQEDRDAPIRLTDRIAPERAEIDLVLIDVLVTDRKRNPIPGLTVEDFELRIDDSPAQISTFEEYCKQPVGVEQSPRQGAPQTITGRSPTPAAGAADPPPRHIVLYFDINQLSEKGKQHAVEASVDYVKDRMRQGDQVMILALKGQPMLLEDFTGDRSRLITTLQTLGRDPQMVDRHYLEERLNINDIMSRDPAFRSNIALAYAEEEVLRTKKSIDAIRNLMPALGSLPGRKTLIHFSESLRDEPGLQYLIITGRSPSSEGIDIRLGINQLHRQANAAGVSLYMVWAAGLGEKGSMGMADASLNVRGVGDTVVLEQALLSGEDSALSLGATLSLETGGVATARTNDLGLAFEAVERDLSCYYVLGYTNTGPGDGARHMIKVSARVKRSRVRHRPYYDDWDEADRLDQRFESALIAPQYFEDLDVKAEAYALAPDGRKTPILVKVEFPLDAVTVVRQPDGVLYGEAEVRTRVWTDGNETCEFRRRIPLTLTLNEITAGRSVIYEAGCELRPGKHHLTVAVLDAGTWDLGAAGAPLPVPTRSTGVTGDVVLWTSSGDDLLHAEDAASIGIHATGSQHGFVPRAQRRFSIRESGLLYSVVCPPPKKERDDDRAILVKRRLYSRGSEVAGFADIELGVAGQGPQGAKTRRSGACQGIFAPIPAGKLGPGRYVFEIEIDGIGSSPRSHRAGIAVSDVARSESVP